MEGGEHEEEKQDRQKYPSPERNHLNSGQETVKSNYNDNKTGFNRQVLLYRQSELLPDMTEEEENFSKMR